MTGVPPAELMLKCRPQSHLDQILPNIKGKYNNNRSRNVGVMYTTKFAPNDYVLVCNFRTAEPQWLPGAIKELSGRNSYKV